MLETKSYFDFSLRHRLYFLVCESKRISCVSFQKSFLFDKRPLSPEINAFKQGEYSQSLLKQMESKREKEIKQRQNRELMDRLEQVQLTEE